MRLFEFISIRVSKKPAYDSPFSPLASVEEYIGLPPGHGRPGSRLLDCLPPCCCQRHTALLLWHWLTQCTISLPKAPLYTLSLILRYCCRSTVSSVRVRPSAAKCIMIISLTSGILAGLRSKYLLIKIILRLVVSGPQEVPRVFTSTAKCIDQTMH